MQKQIYDCKNIDELLKLWDEHKSFVSSIFFKREAVIQLKLSKEETTFLEEYMDKNP